MTPHDLLANFETLAEAPNGLQRLRELVLELAVRGKLVEQEHSDEPAEELLQRIQAYVGNSSRQKASRPRNGKSSIPDQEAEDVDGWPLPQGWCRVPLARLICRMDAGWSPACPGRTTDSEEEWGVLKTTAIQANSFEPQHHKALPPQLAPRPECEVMSGDLLVTRAGPWFRVGVCCFVITCRPRLMLSDKIIRCGLPQGLLDGRWIALCINSGVASGFLRAKQTGMDAAQVNISQGRLAMAPIEVPPLAEQRRIVARVDELMALLDRLEAKRQEREAARTAARDSALAALREALTPEDVETAWLRIQERFHELFAAPEDVEPLRQAVLFLAGEGRLVPQDPREDSAFDLLNQIERAHQPRTKRGVTQLKNSISSPEPVGESGVLPKGWAWASIEQCCEVVGGIQKTAARRPRNNPYPYLRVANVQRGRFDLSEVAQFELEPDELDRWRLEPADLLIVEGNGSEDEIGRCAMWNGQIPNCVHQNHLIRCRAAISTLAPYILHYLNSPQGITTMKSLAVTTSGLFNLSVGKIRSIWFPMPPKREQHRILQRTGELMRIIDQLKMTLANEYKLASAFAAAAVHHLDA